MAARKAKLAVLSILQKRCFLSKLAAVGGVTSVTLCLSVHDYITCPPPAPLSFCFCYRNKNQFVELDNGCYNCYNGCYKLKVSVLFNTAQAAESKHRAAGFGFHLSRDESEERWLTRRWWRIWCATDPQRHWQISSLCGQYRSLASWKLKVKTECTVKSDLSE